jgi:hypothetical protein
MIYSSEIDMDGMNWKGAKLLYVEQHRYGTAGSKHREPYYVLYIELPDGSVTARMYDPAVVAQIDAYDEMVSSSFN